jgi:two-component sensor histidine kinase
MGIHADITERKKSDLQIAELNHHLDVRLQQLEHALEQRSVLLREVQHRVKNNLQVIWSLISLEAERLSQSALRKPFEEMRDRIRAMAMVHENLSRSDDLARIDFRGYVERLTTQFLSSYSAVSTGIELVIDVDVKVGMNEALPCGLIIQELLSNSMKHAFPAQTGRISIEFRQHDGELVLCYRDDGVGLPSNLDVRNPESLGLQLINDLALQLGAELEVSNAGGAMFTLRFKPEHAPKTRDAGAT